MTEPTSRLATQRQRAALTFIAQRYAYFGSDVNYDETQTRMAALLADPDLTLEAASALIDQARNRTPWGSAAPAQPQQLSVLLREAERKAVFGLTVNVEETLTRAQQMIDAGMTVGQFRELQRSWHNAKPHPTSASPLPLRLIEGLGEVDVVQGCFAVMVDEKLRFYRIYEPGSGEYRDQAVIRRFAGERETALYPDEARKAIEAIMSSPDEAAFRFADEHTRCAACARVLTDAVSRMLSVGPQCRNFKVHSGLRHTAEQIDASSPQQRSVYRAFHGWAMERGLRDPRTATERQDMGAQAMTSVRFGAAWSALPGMSMQSPDAALALARTGSTSQCDPRLVEMIDAAPADTLVDLINTGALGGDLLRRLGTSRSKKVRDAAALFVMDFLAAT